MPQSKVDEKPFPEALKLNSLRFVKTPSLDHFTLVQPTYHGMKAHNSTKVEILIQTYVIETTVYIFNVPSRYIKLSHRATMKKWQTFSSSDAKSSRFIEKQIEGAYLLQF